MIEIKITPKILDTAKNLYGFYNIKNSITKGMSQDYGALGEAVFMEYYGIPLSSYQQNNTKDFDFLVNGKKIDVKTKVTTVKPRPEYLCNVSEKSYSHQQCDWYCFIRVDKKMETAWLLGFVSKQELPKQGIFYKKGDIDPTSSKGFVFSESCWNIEISKLNLSKSTKINRFFLESFGYTVEENGNFIETNFIKCTKNGFDIETKISINANSNHVVIKTPHWVLVDCYLSTQTEFNTQLEFLRLKF